MYDANKLDWPDDLLHMRQRKIDFSITSITESPISILRKNFCKQKEDTKTFHVIFIFPFLGFFLFFFISVHFFLVYFMLFFGFFKKFI